MKFCVQWMIGLFFFFCVEGFSIESEANQEKLNIETFEAVAYSTEEKILYRELHRIQRKNQRIIYSETRYLNPEGEKIAEMISINQTTFMFRIIASAMNSRIMKMELNVITRNV